MTKYRIDLHTIESSCIWLCDTLLFQSTIQRSQGLISTYRGEKSTYHRPTICLWCFIAYTTFMLCATVSSFAFQWWNKCRASQLVKVDPPIFSDAWSQRRRSHSINKDLFTLFLFIVNKPENKSTSKYRGYVPVRNPYEKYGMSLSM